MKLALTRKGITENKRIAILGGLNVNMLWNFSFIFSPVTLSCVNLILRPARNTDRAEKKFFISDNIHYLPFISWDYEI